jgi:hypothetical protein
MTHWVAMGTVAIDALLPAQKIETIQDALVRMSGKPFGAVKQALGDDVAYSEIKMVQAHLKHIAVSGGTES